MNMKIQDKKRLIIGMSGSSGAVLGIELLKVMQEYSDWQTHLVISKGAEETIIHESSYNLQEVISLADEAYSIDNIAASIASGTFKTEGMIIIPCSMKTVAGVASGYSDNLLLRAADVIIKEQRKLVLVTRESPLSPIHLRNMLFLAELGVMIMPPMPSYYNNPVYVEEINKQIIGKILDKFNIELEGFKRWGEKN